MDVKQLHQKYGQSVWLDYIRRHLLQSGEFERLVQEDGIRGVTSNPSIFEKAIAGSTDYESALERDERHKDQTAAEIYEHLAVEDIQQAADILRPVYDESDRRDGFVSMEVSPYLAHDTHATIDEATRLWSQVRRDNLMIKVPATPEGIPAIRQLISQGINVNITLLFSRAVCRQVTEAYMDGLETLAAHGGDLARIASVASMFVSRLDVLVDPILEARTGAGQERLRGLVGKVAIANAKLAYQDWKELCRGPRWQALAARGARAQRLLWASTGTKDPRFSDVLYVESLIGPDTVDTIPPATIDAFRDHGKAESRLEEDIDEARQVLATLARTGISIDDLTARLLDDGVREFSAAFDRLMGAIEKKRDGVLTSALDRMSYRLPAPLDGEVKATLKDWRTTGKVRRLWARDASLWTGHDENRWLDWLNIANEEQDAAQAFAMFAKEVQRDFTHAVVLGMGGSSLCPDVLARTFGLIRGCPEALALFTDERNHVALERAVGLDKTLHGYLRAHLERLGRGDYFALLAYVERNDAHDHPLQTIRRTIRDSRHVATCVGFGPRFLHSTGQAYKGGPNSGVFLQLTCDDAHDLMVPGHRFSFGVVKAAQARGDFRVLVQRERRALRVHLGSDVRRGLDLLQKAITRALT